MRSNTGIASGSTNVVAFPLKAQSAERLRARGLAVPKLPAASRPVVYDGAGYHDEAIEEERAARTDH